MADKLNKVVAVAALHSICDEAKANANSGDIRIAGESRRDYLTASILLQLLSNVDDAEFNNTELAALPTPDELNAAAADNPSTATNIVTSQAPVTPPQPANADDLAAQGGGAPSISLTTPPADPTPPADETPPADSSATPPADNLPATE